MLVPTPNFTPSPLDAAPALERLLRRIGEGIIADARAGRAGSAAGEWLLQNYSCLRGQIRDVRESLPRSFYRKLPRATGRGEPRVLAMAREFSPRMGEHIETSELCEWFDTRQMADGSALLLSELWAVRPMLKIACFEWLMKGLASGPLESDEVEAEVRRAITALRAMADVIWAEFVEALCLPGRILSDGSETFARMDFATRDAYRRAVERFSRRSGFSEERVANIVVELARENGCDPGELLIGARKAELRHATGARRKPTEWLADGTRKVPTAVYLGGTAVLTALLLWAVHAAVPDLPPWFFLVLVVPATQAALTVANLLVSYFLVPRVLPRMDFREGIPAECRTVVVMPTLLLSRSGAEQLIGNLEIYHLANRDANLMFALLTDFADADEEGASDTSILEACVSGIHELNKRYRTDSHQPFLLFHRAHEWNESEGKWMGRERKRGKLDAFNAFVLGRENAFAVIEGDSARVRGAKYVITLDSDTQLPRDTAYKLVGTMAHPLNRPQWDEHRRVVSSGYALMLPRIGISMESASRSRFASIFSGQTGFDPYTTAVSDVYQDLFGRGTFTGKGIYDVAAFDRATRGRFPDNALLSHDLIEGEHVRTALVTDLEMIDDYPSRYQAFSKRKHRWVRGDWQIAMWLLPRVPNSAWKWGPNPLPVVSRWKILDNLRRSLVEPAYLLAFALLWLALPEEATAGSLAAVALLLSPIYADLCISLLRLPPWRFLRPWAWTRFSDFLRGHVEALLTLVFLPAQAMLLIDAIARTLHRRIRSQRRLLQWESMAQTEMRGARGGDATLRETIRGWSLPERYMAVAVALSAVLWTVLLMMPEMGNLPAFLLLLSWVASPLVMIWLNAAPESQDRADAGSDYLRGLALSTWRFFSDQSQPAQHWIVPDNIQEEPAAVARRTSPTNLGLQLNAYVAAHRFGYLTHGEMAESVARLQAVLQRLPRERGHFFNWYDTQSLQTLHPRFVSTVDSGNLAASLMVTRAGCLAVETMPVIDGRVMHALRDYLRALMEAVPPPVRTSLLLRGADNLRRQLESEPDDLFFWEGVLTEAQTLAQKLGEAAERAAVRTEAKDSIAAAEIRYWAQALQARIAAELAALGDLIPWIHQPFESELRTALRNPLLSELLEPLRRVPHIADLPSVYDRIAAIVAEIDRADSRIHQTTSVILRQLGASLDGARARWGNLTGTFHAEAERAQDLWQAMDFRFLLDARRKLLRIGWDADRGEAHDSYYDLLASEARTAVFVAIARGDAPREAWFNLSRKLTYYRGHRTLVSWSGTMFEYLMPALFMQTWAGTLLGESVRSAVRIQKLYAREMRVPWGISESAHSVRDAALNYQYRAFGVPSLSLDRAQPDDLVIAPYATILSSMVDTRGAIENLRAMEARGWRGRYGFYESIDFRKHGAGPGRAEVIRAFMVHHQGMSFLALANVLLDNAIQSLFHSDPAVLATELLLQERMPALAEAEAPEEPFAGLAVAQERTAGRSLEAEPI